MRILHVDDNYDIAGAVKKILAREHFRVDHAPTALIADEMITIDEYDLLLLDVKLPDTSGTDFCYSIRERGVGTPVIMLTVLADPEHRISGLDCGADDYISKPFHSGELIARIRTLLRRRSRAPTPVLKVCNLRLDPARHTVHRGNDRIELLPKEFAILEHLIVHAGIVRGKEQIGENVWGIEYDPRSNLIESYISRIRRKISGREDEQIIETIRGVGYRIAEPA